MDMFTPTGWVARYQRTTEQGNEYTLQRAVESFASDGAALVVDGRRGLLCPAAELPGFVGLAEGNRLPITVVPCPPGWRAVGKSAEGEEWVEPVIAWLVGDIGTGTPLVVDRSSGVLERIDDLGEDFVVRGPDEDGS
jgi:hypothetical protein